MRKHMASAIKTSTSFISFICLSNLSYYLYYGFFACNLLSQVLCEITSPSEINGIAGQDVTFHFKTTGKNPIKAAKFGLDNGREEGPSPKFITVIIDAKGRFREICGNDLNGPAAARYKNRVLFEGDLNEGHASFRLKNLTLDDTNLYLCKIREDSDENYSRTNRIKLTVLEKETTSPPKVSERKYKEFEGVANKTCKSYSIFHGENYLAIYDATVSRNEVTLHISNTSSTYSKLLNHLIVHLEKNGFTKYCAKIKVNRKVTAWFHIKLAEAVNRTYAYSFLESAQRNNQLNGYNITCFEQVDVNPHPVDKTNASKLSPHLVIVFVIFTLIVLVLVIVGVILYKFNPDLVQPFIALVRDRRLGELVCNMARRQ